MPATTGNYAIHWADRHIHCKEHKNRLIIQRKIKHKQHETTTIKKQTLTHSCMRKLACLRLRSHPCTYTQKKNMLARRWELEQRQLAHPESSSWVPLQITGWQLKLSPVRVPYNVCACWSLLRQLPLDSCSEWSIYTSTIISTKGGKNNTMQCPSNYTDRQVPQTSNLSHVVNERTLCPISNRCPMFELWGGRVIGAV